MLAKHQGGGVILVTFLIALILTVLPLPDWAQDFRPQWVALVLIYWCLALPERIGVITGWTVGIGLDILTSTLLGQHALGLSIVAYLVLKLHRRLRIFPVWQQATIVAVLLLVDRLLSLWVMGAVHLPAPSFWYWMPPFISMFIWPIVFILLRGVRRSYRVT